MDKTVRKADGSLKVSNEVIIKIAELAASEITGVASENQRLVVNESPVTFANKLISPISVKIVDDSCQLEISIVTIHGNKAAEVAERVQESVKSAIQNMTGIAVSKVNVKVTGIQYKNNI